MTNKINEGEKEKAIEQQTKNPYKGQVVNIDGVEYKRENLSKEANKIVDELKEVENKMRQLSNMYTQSQGIEGYLVQKLKELLKK